MHAKHNASHIRTALRPSSSTALVSHLKSSLSVCRCLAIPVGRYDDPALKMSQEPHALFIPFWHVDMRHTETYGLNPSPWQGFPKKS